MRRGPTARTAVRSRPDPSTRTYSECPLWIPPPSAASDGRSPVNRVERGLRRLALSDERTVRSVLAEPEPSRRQLDSKCQALVRLGALLSIDAATVSLRWTVELA